MVYNKKRWDIRPVPQTRRRTLKLFKMLGLMTTLVAFVSLPAMGAILEPASPPPEIGEWNLVDIYNELYGTSYSNNADLTGLQSDQELWSGSDRSVHVEAVWRNAYLTQVFGFYTVGQDDSPDYNFILDGVANPGNVEDLRGLGFEATFDSAEDFGFFDYAHLPEDANVGMAWHSEADRNNYWYDTTASGSSETVSIASVGEDHMLVFSTPDPNTYLLAFEDLGFDDPNSHYDFNDMLVEISFEVVPEPSSIALLGMGIAGVLARRMRKKA